MQVLKISLLVFVFILSNGNNCFAQPKLKILFTRFGHLKKYEIYPGEELRYKLHGRHHITTDRIVALHDSVIVLEQDSVIVSEIKAISVYTNNYHVKLFRKIFLVGGIGYPLLNLFNNSMNHVTPVIGQNAIIISGSFLVASFLLHLTTIKRIRITKNKIIKIVDIDFENLNRK